MEPLSVPSDAPAEPAHAAREEAPAPAELVPLDPRVRWLWLLTGYALVLQVAIPILVVDLLGVLPPARWLVTGLWLLVGFVIATVLPFVRHRRWRYAVRDHDLWIRQGVLWVTVSVIPFSRLQFVDTKQGPLDRLFGLAQLVVHTAALGTSGRLPGLDSETAERLRERLADVDADAPGV